MIVYRYSVFVVFFSYEQVEMIHVENLNRTLNMIENILMT